jgi:hypothetical protein
MAFCLCVSHKIDYDDSCRLSYGAESREKGLDRKIHRFHLILAETLFMASHPPLAISVSAMAESTR